MSNKEDKQIKDLSTEELQKMIEKKQQYIEEHLEKFVEEHGLTIKDFQEGDEYDLTIIQGPEDQFGKIVLYEKKAEKQIPEPDEDSGIITP